MAKKEIKYGTGNLPEEAFLDENVLIRVSLMLPMSLVKDLKKLALTDEFGGKYQTLARQILLDHTAYKKKSRGKTA